ncbi:hypothetical protein HNY73_019275 [Argiope bruennichi]|uniref:Uncharacterized protein n=1 Tax=Argiope bruennichi TaxID=94029 RepID=A0A8T0EGY5_ARGBR|nr:hypothetical protein HNY73_019275 [Argiope bruennichi]
MVWECEVRCCRYGVEVSLWCGGVVMVWRCRYGVDGVVMVCGGVVMGGWWSSLWCGDVVMVWRMCVCGVVMSLWVWRMCGVVWCGDVVMVLGNVWCGVVMSLWCGECVVWCGDVVMGVGNVWCGDVVMVWEMCGVKVRLMSLWCVCVWRSNPVYVVSNVCVYVWCLANKQICSDSPVKYENIEMRLYPCNGNIWL